MRPKRSTAPGSTPPGRWRGSPRSAGRDSRAPSSRRSRTRSPLAGRRSTTSPTAPVAKASTRSPSRSTGERTSPVRPAAPRCGAWCRAGEAPSTARAVSARVQANLQAHRREHGHKEAVMSSPKKVQGLALAALVIGSLVGAAGCAKPATTSRETPAAPEPTRTNEAAKTRELEEKAAGYEERFKEIQASDMSADEKAQATGDLVDEQQRTVREAEDGSAGEGDPQQ